MNDTSLASRRLVAAPSTLQAFPADLSLMSLARAMPHPCSCLLLAPARGCSIAAPRRAPLRLPGAARSCFDHGRRQLSRLHLALPLLFPPAAYCQVPVLLSMSRRQLRLWVDVSELAVIDGLEELMSLVSCAVKSIQFKSSQVKSSQVKSGQVRSSQVKSGQVKSSQVKPNQVRSSWVNSSQIKSGQVKSGQAQLPPPPSRAEMQERLTLSPFPVFMCASMSTCMSTPMPGPMSAPMSTVRAPPTHAWVCACMYVCMRVCAWMYVCMHVCACMYVCMCVCTCMYVCMCECVRV